MLGTALFSVCLTLRLAAATPAPTTDQAPIAEPPPALSPPPTPAQDDQKKLEDAIRLRLAEHALKKASKSAPAAATTPAPGTTAAPVTTAPAQTVAANATPAKEDPATMLPRVEVSKSRITELTIQQHELDVEIAREKKNTKPTTLDDTLNDSDVAHKVSILGGSSSEDRARLAQERISLLEAEKDLLDEIATAPTKAERDELQKQMDELKTMRRELERTPKDERK
jgi:hypothetical protein